MTLAGGSGKVRHDRRPKTPSAPAAGCSARERSAGPLPAPAPARAARGPHRGRRRRQGGGGDGAGRGGPLGRTARGPRRHPLRPPRADAGDRSGRGCAPGAGCGRPRSRGTHPCSGGNARCGRSRALPRLGRGLGAAHPAGAGNRARRQAGGDRRCCCARAPRLARSTPSASISPPSRAGGWARPAIRPAS